ncbi:MAG TPA: RCC1 repeat-containing protein, partial [Polyangia bacterium]
ATPTKIASFPPSGLTATAVSAGGGHSCARLSDGSVWCWGNNFNGQLGAVSTMMVNTTPVSYVPLKVSGLPAGAVTVSAGSDETCAALTDGSVWCWGGNSDGDLGNNSAGGTPSMTPVKVSGLSGATTVSCSNGSSSVCATCTGGVCCWGDDTDGQLGNHMSNTLYPAPVMVSGLGSVASLSMGIDHACAVKPDGTVWCWGLNSFNQLGNNIFNAINNGTVFGYTVPVQVSYLSSTPMQIVGSGYLASCALANDGSAWCWGDNQGGELGVGESVTTGSAVPFQLTGW